MNIGNIGATSYNIWTRMGNEAATKGISSNKFSEVVGCQGTATNLVLHGVSEEMKEQGYTSVGLWADARTGNSTSVYKSTDFNESNPVYLVKTWDVQGNVTEKEVNMNEVDLRACNVYEMYAYSCYLSDTGKYMNAETTFMKSLPVGNDMSQFGLASQKDIYTKKVDWLSIIKGWMDMQYNVGNMKGYLDYKGFYDFMLNSFDNRR